ncbi:unnamed protein product [Closterium sp. NIES-54]
MALTIHKIKGLPVKLEYTLTAYHLEGNMPPTMMHVHKAAEGSNGPKVLDLPCKYRFLRATSEFQCNGVLGKNKKELTPAFFSLLKAILADPEGFYVNLHTKKYPNGALRGQIFE